MNKTIILATAIAFAGCTAGFEETNRDPNTIAFGDMRAKNFLEPLIYEGSKSTNHHTWYWSDQLMQFESFTGTTREEHRYKIGEQDWRSIYNHYAKWSTNADAMQRAAVKEGLPVVEAVAMTLKAYYVAGLTDSFGDVPFSEAFGGRDGVLEPRYDTQQEIYTQLFAMLERANEIYGSTTVSVAEKEVLKLDGMFAGDAAGWRRFNNSLYLRCLMRVSGRTEMNAAAKIAEIASDKAKYPLIESNAHNAAVHYTPVAPYQNYFASTTRDNFNKERRLAKQFVDMTVTMLNADGTQTLVDPRLNIWAHKDNFNNKSSWRGVVSGGAPTDPAYTASTKGASQLRHAVLCRPDFAYTLIDAAEVRFIMAEAALRGMIPGGVDASKTFYESAVRASIERWAAEEKYAAAESDWMPEKSVTEAKITDYLDNQYTAFDTSSAPAELFEKIGNQKFLALFWNGLEAWHEYRRTGFPRLTIGSGTSFNDNILPTRFAYVQSAIGSNRANAEAAIARMKGHNDMKQPLWWSRQAIETGYYE